MKAAAIGRVLPRLCRAAIRVSGTSAFNLLQNNGSSAHQAVNHVHFHIIPKPSEEAGLGLKWRAGSLDQAAAKTMAARVRELCDV